MKKKISIRVKLLVTAILPVVLIGEILTGISIIWLKNSMMDEALEGLMSSAKLYCNLITTSETELYEENEIEDTYKAATGYDFTKFDGDTRVATSVVKSDGARPIETQAADNVIDAVLVKGQDYTSEKTDVAGQEYCVAYAPIKDDSGKVVGIAFAGKPTAEINKQVAKVVLIIVFTSLFILILL